MKSFLSSALAVYMQFAEGENAPSIVSVATKRDQAKLIFDVSKRMINNSPHLSPHAQVRLNEIRTEFNHGVFKPLASDSNSLDGLNINVACHDELHSYKDANLYNVVVDGMSARNQPLTFITTTNGFVRNGIFDLKYDEATRIINGLNDKDGYKDDTILPFIYELDEFNEWKEEEKWEKANPAIGTIKNKEALATKVHQALHNPLLVNNLVTKDFNVASANENAWLTWEELNNETKYDLSQRKPLYVIGGVDLSKSTDLTSASVLWKYPDDDNIYFKSMYWLPADILHERVEEDKIPYDVYVQQDLMRLSEGSVVDYKDVTAWFKELRDELGIYTRYIGYDSWNGLYLRDELANLIGEMNVLEVRQGAKTFSQPMFQMEALFKSHNIVYDNNPLTKWNLSNVFVEMDNNGNIRPVKSRKGKRTRIDGFMAMLNAYVVFKDHENEYDSLMS